VKSLWQKSNKECEAADWGHSLNAPPIAITTYGPLTKSKGIPLYTEGHRKKRDNSGKKIQSGQGQKTRSFSAVSAVRQRSPMLAWTDGPPDLYSSSWGLFKGGVSRCTQVGSGKSLDTEKESRSTGAFTPCPEREATRQSHFSGA